jgi:hypothetical protein
VVDAITCAYDADGEFVENSSMITLKHRLWLNFRQTKAFHIAPVKIARVTVDSAEKHSWVGSSR